MSAVRVAGEFGVGRTTAVPCAQDLLRSGLRGRREGRFQGVSRHSSPFFAARQFFHLLANWGLWILGPASPGRWRGRGHAG
eukprot:4248252-Lingulodinium_polyedra.AAC.1